MNDESEAAGTCHKLNAMHKWQDVMLRIIFSFEGLEYFAVENK